MCKFDLVSIGLRISGINSRAKILLKIYGLNPGKLKKKMWEPFFTTFGTDCLC